MGEHQQDIDEDQSAEKGDRNRNADEKDWMEEARRSGIQSRRHWLEENVTRIWAKYRTAPALTMHEPDAETTDGRGSESASKISQVIDADEEGDSDRSDAGLSDSDVASESSAWLATT